MSPYFPIFYSEMILKCFIEQAPACFFLKRSHFFNFIFPLPFQKKDRKSFNVMTLNKFDEGSGRALALNSRGCGFGCRWVLGLLFSSRSIIFVFVLKQVPIEGA